MNSCHGVYLRNQAPHVINQYNLTSLEVWWLMATAYTWSKLFICMKVAGQGNILYSTLRKAHCQNSKVFIVCVSRYVHFPAVTTTRMKQATAFYQSPTVIFRQCNPATPWAKHMKNYSTSSSLATGHKIFQACSVYTGVCIYVRCDKNKAKLKTHTTQSYPLLFRLA
jgi:hypothetical protein